MPISVNVYRGRYRAQEKCGKCGNTRTLKMTEVATYRARLSLASRTTGPQRSTNAQPSSRRQKGTGPNVKSRTYKRRSQGEN